MGLRRELNEDVELRRGGLIIVSSGLSPAVPLIEDQIAPPIPPLRDPAIRGYLAELMRDEITPLLEAPHGMDLAGYRRTLIDRFSNSEHEGEARP